MAPTARLPRLCRTKRDLAGRAAWVVPQARARKQAWGAGGDARGRSSSAPGWGLSHSG